MWNSAFILPYEITSIFMEKENERVFYSGTFFTKNYSIINYFSYLLISDEDSFNYIFIFN